MPNKPKIAYVAYDDSSGAAQYELADGSEASCFDDDRNGRRDGVGARGIAPSAVLEALRNQARTRRVRVLVSRVVGRDVPCASWSLTTAILVTIGVLAQGIGTRLEANRIPDPGRTDSNVAG